MIRGQPSAGQLLKVLDDYTHKTLEHYAYDKAGNMIEKIVGTTRTVMTYDAANQLTSVASVPAAAGPMEPRTDTSPAASPNAASAAQVIRFQYDPAGRLVGSDGGPQRQLRLAR